MFAVLIYSVSSTRILTLISTFNLYDPANVRHKSQSNSKTQMIRIEFCENASIWTALVGSNGSLVSIFSASGVGVSVMKEYTTPNWVRWRLWLCRVRWKRGPLSCIVGQRKHKCQPVNCTVPPQMLDSVIGQCRKVERHRYCVHFCTPRIWLRFCRQMK